MITPIATKNLGDQNQWGLPAVMKIWSLNIDAKTETVIVSYEIVTVTPTGVEDVRVSSAYRRFNSRTTDVPSPASDFKATTQDNLKFDQLRESPVGQGIIALISNDVEAFDGTPESIAQIIHTTPLSPEPQP